MRVAACNWKSRESQNFSDFAHHFEQVIQRAERHNVELLVLPELLTLELLYNRDYDEADAVKVIADFAEPYFELVSESARYGTMTIVGGSTLEISDGVCRNVCPVVRKDGEIAKVYKRKHTQYEKEFWMLDSGPQFAGPGEDGVAVLICYDAEFPEAARSLAQAGAKILCVPAYTETPFGFNRVRGSIVARCIENQFFAVHSSLVGGFGKEPFVKSYGSSAVLGPLHRPYPPSGVLKETSFEAEELAIEDVDLAQVEKLRTSAETRNYEDRNADVWSL